MLGIAQRVQQQRRLGRTESRDPKLRINDALFVLEYLIDRNGTRAYRASHPRCQSDNAAAVQASRTLRKPKVAAYLKFETRNRVSRLRMDADEALALISMNARADIRDLFDSDTGRVLPPHLWPDSIRQSVKKFVYKNGCTISVTMKDGLRACQLMAQAGGKLTNIGVRGFDVARYLAGRLPIPERKEHA